MGNAKAITVAYDASVLGRGYLDIRSRSGIFRAIESLLYALVEQEVIHLETVALANAQDYWDDIVVRQYFKDKDDIGLCHYMSIYSSRLNASNFYGDLSEYQRQLITLVQKSRFFPLYRLAFAAKKILWPILKVDLSYVFSASAYQVYHSPFFALPGQNLTGDLARILTIYDLIPVLYPEFTSKKIHQTFQGILSSLDTAQDWVICDSQNTRNDLCSYLSIDPNRVFVTPLAADDHFFPINNKHEIDAVLNQHRIPLHPYLLSLCTLEPRKNLVFLIKCFSKLVAETPNFDLNLVLVGAIGWKNQALFNELLGQDSALRSRIILAGYIPDSDLSAVYSGATAFLYPSLYEGFGLPPLEAMQCGIPVITSNTSSLPEVVGDAGIMVDPTDEDAFCQAILNLLKDQTLHADLSQRGLARAKQFSWAKCAQQTVEVYKIAAENR
ncbi:MAG: glycosyltransferase family 4 protein [Nodosilinea sp.]